MRKFGLGLGVVALASLCLSAVFFFQNCAEVQFLKTGAQNEEILGENMGRTIFLVPTTKSILPTTPIKVLLVIDNSVSMALSQKKLQQNLLALLEPLRGYPVELKVISTSSLKQSPLIEPQGWSYKITNLNANTKIAEAWKDKFNIADHEVITRGYDVFYYLNNVDFFHLEAQDPNFNSKINAIQNRILQISSSLAGDDREQGLCSTLLALYDQGPNRFFHPGDKAAIVILSDEDDSSRWHTFDTKEYRRDCRNRYTYGAIGDTLKPSVQRADYNLETWSIRFEVSYDQLNDGQLEPRMGGDRGGLPLPVSEKDLVAGQLPSTILSCDSIHLERALNYAHALFPQPKNQNHRITKCEIKSSWTALYGFGTADEDRCTSSFVINEKAYLSLFDYFEKAKNRILSDGSCKRKIHSSLSERSFSDFYIDQATDPIILNAGQISTKDHQKSIQQAIVKRALSLFGENGFFISSIVNKTDECLSPGSVQSIGSAYMSLGAETSAENLIHSYSICMDSYAPAMDDLAKQIQSIIDGDIILPVIEADEIIQSVTLLREGNRKQLTLNVEYTVERNEAMDKASVLRITGLQLQTNDKIEVVISPAE